MVMIYYWYYSEEVDQCLIYQDFGFLQGSVLKISISKILAFVEMLSKRFCLAHEASVTRW